MEDIVARWMLLAAVFLVGELLIRTYYLLSPSTGAFVASLAANVKFPFWGQWSLFLSIALILTLVIHEIKRSE